MLAPRISTAGDEAVPLDIQHYGQAWDPTEQDAAELQELPATPEGPEGMYELNFRQPEYEEVPEHIPQNASMARQLQTYCYRRGWYYGYSSSTYFTCTTNYRLPTATEDAIAAPCYTASDRSTVSPARPLDAQLVVRGEHAASERRPANGADGTRGVAPASLASGRIASATSHTPLTRCRPLRFALPTVCSRCSLATTAAWC